MIYKVTDNQEIIETLERYRKQQSTDIHILCELAQIDRATYYRALQGKQLSILSLLRLCNALGVTLMMTQSPTYYENK